MHSFAEALNGPWRAMWSCSLAGAPRRSGRPDAKHQASHKCSCQFLLVAEHEPQHPDSVFVSELHWHTGHDPTDGRHLHLSEQDEILIMTMLDNGSRPRQIQHFFNTTAAARQRTDASTSGRDMLSDFSNARKRITVAQVENIRRRLRHERSLGQSDIEDTKLILEHYQKASDAVLLHHAYKAAEGTVPEQPLMIIISHPVQRALIHELGGLLIHLDASYGIVRYGYPMFALLLADEFGNGVPVAHMICTGESADEVELFIDTVQTQVQKDFADRDRQLFRFRHVMIDKSKAEICALGRLDIMWVLCYFHVLQELQRFLRSAESGVKDKAEQQRILREIRALKLCKTAAEFNSRSAEFVQRNQGYPSVVQR